MPRLSVRALPVLLGLLLLPCALTAQSLTGFTADRAADQQACEAQLLELPTAEAFRDHLERLTRDPHPAGSAANEAVADYLAETMAAAGLSVERYPYDLYMPSPSSAYTADVALVTPVRQPLNRQEYMLADDRFSDHPDLAPGWNAYSGSGEVTAEVVYANYGRKEDFEQLEALGVDLTDKIVVARYGGNFRGYKAKYAEAYGAAGLLMYTDPADGGYASGLPYPEGRYVNESGIQRGSILTPLAGDPLTPDGPALPLDHPDTPERLDPEDVALPRIPVTPLPYGSAVEILERMQGAAVPDGWQGALPFTYRVTGGADLTVRLRVEQPLDFVRATNIVGTIEGTTAPDEWIILGSHFDAWAFGATDPNSGTAMLLVLADALATLAANGCAPRRSIMIAHWDAEEYGILGSTEWVRQLEDTLDAQAVTYINADGAATGTRFRAAAAPTLKRPILEAAQAVPHPDADATTVFDHYQAQDPDAEEPPIGNLGGGSDHVGFLTYIGIPSASVSMSSASPIYHSNYDSFAWYERFGDPDFIGGPTLALVDGILALRLANADVLPYDVARYAVDLEAHLTALEERAASLDVAMDTAALRAAQTALKGATAAFEEARAAYLAATGPERDPTAINRGLLQLERAFIIPEGLQNRPLSRSLYVSPDPFSGYASWMLPGLRYELETDGEALDAWMDRYVAAVQNLTARIAAVTEQLER